MEIKEEIKKIAKNNGFELTENADRIIQAKIKFFGENNWRQCPCDKGNSERFCCSQLCQSDIRAFGTCHCHLFKLNKN